MSNGTKIAIENKHKKRKEHGSSSTLYKIAKAVSKKLVKMTNLNSQKNN